VVRPVGRGAAGLERVLVTVAPGSHGAGGQSSPPRPASWPSGLATTNFASFADTDGNFATGVNNTGGKFATHVNDTSGNLPLVSTPLVSTRPAENLPLVSNVNDTGCK
jgi:hypothetical protein